MKIYHDAPNMLVIVQPGNDFPEKSEWRDSEKNAILFNVQFKNGVADVAKELAQYMIDKKLAKRSPIIIAQAMPA